MVNPVLPVSLYHSRMDPKSKPLNPVCFQKKVLESDASAIYKVLFSHILSGICRQMNPFC